MPVFWEESPSVLCGVLSVEVAPMAWALNLRNLLPREMPICTVAGRPYDQARNIICQQALDGGFDYLFFLDGDVTPPHDAVPRLMAHRLPLVSGVYHRRSPPHGLPVMQRNGQFMTSYPVNSLIEVDTVGAGCMLIRRDLLESMPPQEPQLGKHWFAWKVDKAHLLPPGEGMSEDFSFCLHVRRTLGVKVMVDTSVQCGHVGWSDYRYNDVRPAGG